MLVLVLGEFGGSAWLRGGFVMVGESGWGVGVGVGGRPGKGWRAASEGL